jgi:hypothetical protein
LLYTLFLQPRLGFDLSNQIPCLLEGFICQSV